MATTAKSAFGEISCNQLMRRIGLPDAPVILDVCLPEDVAEASFRIPTSLPATHEAIDSLIPMLRGREVIVVCQKGKKLSHGTAALLRAHGIAAEVLAGGMVAWCATDLPRIPIASLPASQLWVTRHRPKIDRIACPWLLRRFVDPTAQMLFVPPEEVLAVAARFDATPFDTPGARFTHRDERCTFDVMLDHFGLTTSPLQTMATVIREADLGRLDTSPQAAGLLAISIGLSRAYKDDTAQVEAALPLYDALYRWARDGMDETHESAVGPAT